jgi:hypothetical protein
LSRGKGYGADEEHFLCLSDFGSPIGTEISYDPFSIVGMIAAVDV